MCLRELPLRRRLLVLESTVEGYLRARVQSYGGRCNKLIDKSRVGAPDREVQWPTGGGIDKVELKKPGGTAEAHQIRYHKFLARCGVPVYLLDTKAKVDIYMAARCFGDHAPELFSVPCTPR